MKIKLLRSTDIPREGEGRTLEANEIVYEGDYEAFVNALKREGWKIWYATHTYLVAVFEHTWGRVMREYEIY